MKFHNFINGNEFLQYKNHFRIFQIKFNKFVTSNS